MKKQSIQFATEIKKGVVTKIGRSTVFQPKTNFKGSSLKWFDDHKLLKLS